MNQLTRLSTLNNGQMGELGIVGDAMVAAGLLGARRNRTEAVLAEPHAGSCSAGSHAAHAQQLQHGLTARQARSLGLFLVRLPFGFPGHGDPLG
jgi:hypothetical protein